MCTVNTKMNKCASFGERLATERKKIGLSQGDFATKCGVSKRSQANYESGARSPDIEYLCAAESIGIDTHFIITGHKSLQQGGFGQEHIEEGIKAFLIEGYRLKWVDTAPDVDWEDIVIMAVDNIRQAAGLEATFGKGDEKGEIVQNKRFKA